MAKTDGRRLAEPHMTVPSLAAAVPVLRHAAALDASGWWHCC
ncbi:MAG TPA: hypothetical protein VHT25_06490 [Solirubrobacteraceae bacterium]|jgi:hypothetical protein|nr:hypothetical protein [Solirubrobacteraceae bacterium]